MKNKKQDISILSEYGENIDLKDTFWDVLKRTRSSIYEIKGIFTVFEELEVSLKKETQEIRNEYNDILNSFNEIDSIFFNQDKYYDENHNEVAITDTRNYKSVYTKIEIDKVLEILIANINLYHRISYLENRILNKILNLLRDKNTFKATTYELNLTLKSERSKTFFIDKFNRSHEEDKIISYCIDCKDKEVKQELKKRKYILPKYLKRQDYKFNNDRIKILVENEYKLNLYLDTLIKEQKHINKIEAVNAEMNKLNKKSFYFSIIIGTIGTIFTILSYIK